MGKSDMHRNADNDVEQENEKYPKRGTDKKATSSEEEKGPIHQRSGRASCRKGCQCYTWKGEAAFTTVLNEKAAQSRCLGEHGQGQGGCF